MTEEIVESWRKITLTKSEQLIAHFDICKLEEISLIERLSLLGLIITDKTINKEAFKSTIHTVWKLKGKINIKEAGFNLFIF